MSENKLMNQSYDLLIFDADSMLWKASASVKDDDPEQYALHNLKNIIDKVLDICNPDMYSIYVGGDTNFRYNIATIRPYKGNRKQPKPKYFSACKDYLLNNWGGEIADGIEADDCCAIEQTKAAEDGLTSCIVSNDKDLLQVPGWNFNYTTNHFKYVTELDGWCNFYRQMLVGDNVDAIVGVKGVGKKNAERILKGATNKADLHQRVENEYKRVYGSDWDRVMLENGRLLYLQRKPDDEWSLNI